MVYLWCIICSFMSGTYEITTLGAAGLFWNLECLNTRKSYFFDSFLCLMVISGSLLNGYISLKSLIKSTEGFQDYHGMTCLTTYYSTSTEQQQLFVCALSLDKILLDMSQFLRLIALLSICTVFELLDN